MATKILIEFDNTRAKGGAKGLAEAAKLFEKAGLKPVDYSVEEKTKRSAGRSYKRVFFNFEDAQRVEMWVTYDKKAPIKGGDIFKVKLGGAGVAESIRATELPITNQDDHAEAIREIVKALQSNEKKFQAKLAKIKVELPPDLTTSKVKKIELLENRIKELDEAIEMAGKELAALHDPNRGAVEPQAADAGGASGEGMPGKSDGDYSDADSLAAKNTDNKSALANAIREKIASRSISSYEAKMAALALPYAKDEEIVTVKNQEIDVKQAVKEWLDKHPDVARNFIYGEGEKEKHTNHRMARIMEAYDAGEQDKLPPIRFEPQFGSVSDGRHRLTAAYLRGEKTIKADLVFDLSRYLDGHWSNK